MPVYLVKRSAYFFGSIAFWYLSESAMETDLIEHDLTVLDLIDEKALGLEKEFMKKLKSDSCFLMLKRLPVSLLIFKPLIEVSLDGSPQIVLAPFV